MLSVCAQKYIQIQTCRFPDDVRREHSPLGIKGPIRTVEADSEAGLMRRADDQSSPREAGTQAGVVPVELVSPLNDDTIG